jgi:uncharacterized protein (TIGR01370 family)
VFGIIVFAQASAEPSIALFYGANPPLDELKAFDVVVVDPDQPGTDPLKYHRKDSELFAYVSVGEASTDKPYFRHIPPAWLRGENSAWGSKVIDQSSPEWPAFFADTIIAPLWKKGYRGFFLDTLDSYQLLTSAGPGRAAQEAGLKAVIHELKRRWPGARLILNRGFEILPDVHHDVWMVAAESLFRSWDARGKNYVEVSEADREWLLGQLRKVQQDYHLPVLVIDYVPSAEREQARDTVQKIRAAGFIPYVTTPNLDTLGIGSVEVVPRKVLVIYDPRDAEDLFYADAVRFLGMPFAYLGLVPEYRSINEPLPDVPLQGRYAGIVSWLNSDEANRSNYAAWLLRQVDGHVPVAVFGHFGFGTDATVLGKLGLVAPEHVDFHDLKLVSSDPAMGFELPLKVISSQLLPVNLSGQGRPLLTLANAGTVRFTPAAITGWGGYALYPYTIGELGSVDGSERWYLNPITFLRAALHIDADVPVPDVTTEMGRRLLMVHIDGDGFPSKVERPGYPMAGRVLLDEVLKRYPIPTTLSVIEGEVAPDGLYPDDAPKMEAIAREAFALPWVEIASHTYSHPFRWSDEQTKAMAKRSKPSSDPDFLPIKGYVFNVEREVGGAARYINTRLAPPGKQVKVLLWPGDCVPTPDALELSYRDGLLNMNGGDTIITASRNSWTNISGLGLEKHGYFQVFAPDENENVYTNLWSGPFYGYERVIETFDMTELPFRFKPVDIYYHPYAVTKTASLTALHKVYQWALKQPLNPVFVSDYINKVLDFNHAVVARTTDGYRIRSDGALRTVRLPAQGRAPDLLLSPGLAGLAPGPAARYLNLVDGSADIVYADHSGHPPYIESANARLTHFRRERQGLRFGLQGYQPLRLTLDNVSGCRLSAGGNTLMPVSHDGDRFNYELASHESRTFRLDCSS